MAFEEIPTQQAFKQACGRTGPGKIFKRKNDLDPIFLALGFAEAHRMNRTMAAIPYFRAVRKACCTWIASNEAVTRVSSPRVKDLFDIVHQTINEIVEQTYGGRRLGLPDKPTLKDVVLRVMEIKGPTPAPVGKTLDETYWIEKVLPNHLGKGAVAAAFAEWKQLGNMTRLNIADWVEYVYAPECEDDEFGKYIPNRRLALAQKIVSGQGVKYCDAQERKSYVMTIKGGLVSDVQDQTADTSHMKTVFSGPGWAIFVMGTDDTLYVHSHEADKFHHSSFLAGAPIHCGGEIKIEAGKITHITPKTGHYKAGAPELKYFLEFCQKGSVNLRGVQVCPSPFSEPKRWFNGYAVLLADGNDPNAEQIAFAEKAPARPTRPVPQPPGRQPAQPTGVKDLIKQWENIGKK